MSENTFDSPLVNKVVPFDFPQRLEEATLAMENVHRGDALLEDPSREVFFFGIRAKIGDTNESDGKQQTNFTPTHDQYMAMHILLEQNLGEKSKTIKHISRCLLHNDPPFVLERRTKSLLSERQLTRKPFR